MHGHDHGHGHERRGADRRSHRRALAYAFTLTLAFLFVEAVAAFATDSLSLLSDAGHMLTDVGGLGMALAAMHLAGRPQRRTDRTFGLYRLEILAALLNALLLFGVAGFVLSEAARRILGEGTPPELPGGVLMVVAVAGLAVNVASFLLLRRGASENLNLRVAYLEVISDGIGSVGVLAAGLVVLLTGWGYADAIVGAAIGLFILPRTYALAREAVRILLQTAPRHVDIEAVRQDLARLPGVVDVHDLHVWTLTSQMEVASAHLMVAVGTDTHAVLDQARVLLSERHHLTHATLQVEPDDHTGCDEVTW